MVSNDDPFCLAYSQDNSTLTITPAFEIPEHYEFVIPSDSSLTVKNTKNIIFHTALGDITRQEKDFSHPHYETEERLINNIPYAYYPIPKINLSSKEGTVVVKEWKLKD